MWYLVNVLVILDVLLVLILLASLILSMIRERNNYSNKIKIMSDIECPLCHEHNIKTRLPITNSFYGGKVGPKYVFKKRKIGLNIMHCAPVYIDVCMNCGYVIKSYIDVPKQALWLHESNPFSKQ